MKKISKKYFLCISNYGDYTFNEVIKKDTYRKFEIVLVANCGLCDLKETKKVLFCYKDNKKTQQIDITQFFNRSESKIEISFGSMDINLGKNLCEFCFYDDKDRLLAVTNTFTLYLK